MPMNPSQRFPFCLEKPKNFAFSLQKSIFWVKSVKKSLGSKRNNNLPSLLQDPFSFWTWVFVAAGYQLRCRVGCNKRDLPPSFAIMVTLLQKFFLKEFKKTTSIDLWVLWNHITSFWCLSNLLYRTHTPFMRRSSSIPYFEELLWWGTVIGSWPARLSKTILMLFSIIFRKGLEELDLRFFDWFKIPVIFVVCCMTRFDNLL